jgi:hypothetical protein
MEYVKKIFIILLAISILNLYLPKIALAQQLLASADVPKHEPQTWGTPEEDIPTKKVKKVSRWTYLIIVGLIGGIAAAASGGGGSSGGDDSDDTGSYTGTW